MALRVANLATTLVTIAVYSRALDPDIFGLWAVLQALVLAATVVDLGLGAATIRHAGASAAEGNRAHGLVMVRSAQHFILARSAPVLVVAAAAVWITAPITRPSVLGLAGLELGLTAMTIALVAIAVAILGLAPKARIGLGEVAESCRLQLLGCAVQVVLVLLLGISGGPLLVYVLISFSSQIVGFGLDTFALTRGIRADSVVPAVRREGWGFVVIMVAGTAGFGLDSVITGAVLGPTEAGLVALAARIVLTPQSFVLAAFAPTWGEFARAHIDLTANDFRSLYRKRLAATVLLGASICGLAGLTATWSAAVLAGDRYQLTTGLVWSTVAAGVVMTASGAVSVALNGLGVVWAQAPIAAASAVGNVLLSILLCSVIGLPGAPLATAIVHALFGLLPSAILAHRHMGYIERSPART